MKRGTLTAMKNKLESATVEINHLSYFLEQTRCEPSNVVLCYYVMLMLCHYKILFLQDKIKLPFPPKVLCS